MIRPNVKCPKCKEKMTVSYHRGIVNHFYCINCREVFLTKEIDWRKQMSTKSTLMYGNTKDVTIHIYFCNVRGHAIDLRFKEFETTLLIDEEQADLLIKQLRDEDEDAK